MPKQTGSGIRIHARRLHLAEPGNAQHVHLHQAGCPGWGQGGPDDGHRSGHRPLQRLPGLRDRRPRHTAGLRHGELHELRRQRRARAEVELRQLHDPGEAAGQRLHRQDSRDLQWWQPRCPWRRVQLATRVAHLSHQGSDDLDRDRRAAEPVRADHRDPAVPWVQGYWKTYPTSCGATATTPAYDRSGCRWHQDHLHRHGSPDAAEPER